MWRIGLFIVFCNFTFISTSNPFRDPNICGRPVDPIVDGKFKYGPTIKQTYKYSVKVQSSFNGTSKNESTLHFDSLVSIEFLSELEGILTLKDVQFTEGGQYNSHSNDFANALSALSLRFSFQDGIINELCPNKEERVWVLNIKRGLLSMLHNTMKRFDLDLDTVESDVNGKCGTKYRVLGSDKTSLVIEKTKDLASCTSRSKLHSVIQSVPYSFRSIRPEESLLDSSSKCILSIDHNIYKSIKCTEFHLLKPFSNRGSGATTSIDQNLVLVKEERASTPTKQEPILKRVSLLFDHTQAAGLVSDDLKNTRNLLEKMCKMDSEDDHIKFSDVFTEMIQSLRLLTPQALLEMYTHSSSWCPTGRRNILDALPFVGTTGSFLLMKDMIIKNEIRPETVNDWMFSVSFTRHPDEEMITAAADLLQKVKFVPSTVLSIGALAHVFCSENENCKDFTGIATITEYIENSLIELYSNNTSTRENHEKMVVYLKALGNAGLISEYFEDRIMKMVEDENLEMEIRIAGIESHRRIPCGGSRSYFEDLYRNPDMDSELRIAAYLQIMKCPSYLLMRTIRNTLENEEVNQVGAFVWSHLNNLLKSAVPSRVEIQGLISDKDLVKKFSGDIRKFSHNYEGSLFFEEFNIGGNYDSNLIFSTKSYFPSSISLNMTVDLFGESVNIFEIDGRMQGFENYLESLFGPKGPWSYSKLQDKIPKFRFARDIGNELMKTQLQSLPNIMENKFGDPKVSMGVKVFGNDLKYITYQGYDEMKDAIDHLNPMHYLRKILSNKEINYHKTMMFLDTTYSIPSRAGLPISLSAIGTSSLNMKLFGTIKADDFSNKKELELKADIKPTISLDVTGSLSVDAFYAKSGLKVKTSMYSSNAIETFVNFKGFKLAHVKVVMPQKKSEIFNSRSELYVFKHGKEEPQYGLREFVVTRSICSWPVIDKTLGLRSCMEYHFINVTKMRHAPYFALAGPAGFRIFLEKLDPKANTFIFDYKWIDSAETSAVTITFDAPGSSLGRIVETNFNLNRHTQNLTLLVKTTAGTILAKGKYKNTPDEKYLEIDVNVNDFKHFDTSISLTRKPVNHGFIYFPKFYLGVNNEMVVEIQGSVKLMNKKGIYQYDVDLKFHTKRISSKLYGYISKTQASIATQLRMMYKFPKSAEQGVDIAFSLANRSKRNIMDLQGTGSFESTAYPQFDFDSKLNLLGGHAHTEGSFNITLNHKDDPMKWTKFGVTIKDKSLDDSTRYLNTLLYFAKPSKNIDVNVDLTYKSKTPNTNVELIVDYAKDKQFSTKLFWHHNVKPLEDIKLELNVTVPSFHPMLASLKINEQQLSHYRIEFNGTWFSGHSLMASGFYLDKSTLRSYDHHAKILVKSPSFEDVFCNLHYYRDKNEIKLSMKFNQHQKDYLVLIKHLNSSPHESSTLLKLKYQSRIYSLLATLFNGDHKRAIIELHIDQLRDINFAAWIHNKEVYKAGGIELKWDANRDPNQKLVISGNFSKIASFNYEANLLASYPGRTLLGNYDFVLRHGHLNTLVRLSWDDDQSFAVIINSDYDFKKRIYLVTTSEIVTPFEGWKQTFFEAGFEHGLNMYSLNGSLQWEKKQHVSLDLFGNYTVDDDFFECKYRSGLVSTLKNIPSLSASISHVKNDSKMDTLLRIQYATEEIVDIKSKWEIVTDAITKNYTGTVVASTPFSGFNKGYLISKVMITKDRYLRGVADLDFDFKKFSISAEGRLKKLTNSMLTVNISTPIEKYSTINGKFGFIEDQRYLVAMVTYPSNILGIEALVSIQSLTEFDTKFILGTPFDVLKRIILVGKLKPKMADFRIGWNSLLGGFSGKWNYINTMNFEYFYIIYTPIENFEENSIILKVFVDDKSVDAEASARVSSQKLGLKVFGEKKPALLKEMGIKIDEIYGRKTKNDLEKEQSEDDDLLNWSGLLEIDTLVQPTIKGTLDIDQKGPVYIIKSKLRVPDGEAIINDRIEYHGLLSVKNKLEIQTPYTSYSLITSDYELDMSPGDRYVFLLNLNYKNGSSLVKNELMTRYLILNEEDKGKTHNVSAHAETPLVSFLNLDGGGSLTIRKDDTSRNYATNMFLITGLIDVASQADLKMSSGLVDADLYLRAKTASVYVPPVYLKYQRKTNGHDNAIEAHLSIPEKFEDEIFLHTDWSFPSIKEFNSYLQLKTPFESFEKSSLGFQVTTKGEALMGNLILDINPIEVSMNNTFENDVFYSVSNFNISGRSFPVEIKCNVTKSTPVLRTLNGILMIRNKQMTISGNIELENQLPMSAHIEFIAKEGTDTTALEYKITTEEEKYKFVGSARNAKNFITVDVDADVNSITQWDAKAKVQTSNEKYKLFTVDANLDKKDDRKILKIDAVTPFKSLEKSKLEASLKNSVEGNHLKINFDTPTRRGNGDIQWLWIYLENMRITLGTELYTNNKRSSLNAEGFYINRNRDFSYLQVGGNINANDNWLTGSNLTVNLPSIQNITFDANLKLPPPKLELHMIKGKLLYTTPIDHIEYLAKYNTDISKKNYGSNGSVLITKKGDNTKIQGNLAVEWATGKGLNNIIEYEEVDNGNDVVYKLSTPKYKSQKAFVFAGSYRKSDDLFHNVTCRVFKPENEQVGFGRINFRELANMNGLMNITIPYDNRNYAGVDFATETSARIYNRYLEAFWPDSSAKIDSKCDIEHGSSLLHRTRRGNVIIEVPIASRHIANVSYIYKESPLHNIGNASIDYNGNRLLDGNYDSVSESRAGFEKDTTHIELLNRFFPVGADYEHKYKYGAPSDGEEAPSEDNKQISLYHLTNRTKFAIEGGLTLETTPNGQQLSLGVKHLNKTVNLKSGYDVLDQEYQQHSRLELGPATWIEYNIKLLNETVNQNFDAQRLQLDVRYPSRTFTALGWYKIGEESISTDIGLEWDVDTEKKSIEAGLDWKKISPRHEQLLLTLKHPSFEKNVTFLTEYEYDDIKLIDARMQFDYCEDPDQKFIMGGVLEDNSKDDIYKYTYNIYATHNGTNLDLQGTGDFFWSSDVYSTNHQKEYKRSYLPVQHSEGVIRLDFMQNEIELKRESLGVLSQLEASYQSNYPIYTGNLSINHEFNEAYGDFDLNLYEKIFRLDYNMTTDGRQSLHMYGDIPDARNAKFDAWRDYEDIKITDVTYYLKMNHSRLIVSSLLWRPDLLQDLQSGLHGGLYSIYNYVIENINETRQYVRSEIEESISGVWNEAKPFLQNYIDDMRELRTIEDDIEKFKIFLNKSYHANEFYIKTIVTVTLYTFDELALKKHFESVPAIISEIWNIMGDSGKRIKESVEWVVEKIKTYYKNITVFLRQLLDGDPIQQLSITLSNILEQYDDFIRKMHVAFIQYVEKLWHQTYDLIVDNWYKMLIAIEPTFLKVVAYSESIAWTTSQEFLDFLYIRKSELMESPYFAKFSNFSHDFDKFYKDMTGNNTLSSIIRYTKVGWNFFRERYMGKLPFTKEMEAIAREILGDLNQLRKLPSIAYLEGRLNQMYLRLQWFYEYFEVERRLQNFLTLLHRKVTDYSQTALQAENRYREAKTKFVFDPNEGTMQLEQKLPMSWHAFNETPNFHEIPELKKLYSIQEFFVTSHTNFWNFYYDYKPYTDPSEWLPPFKAQALIIGNKHYVTFDRKVYEFKGECSYLLSTDFKDHNFSLVVSYQPNAINHEILLVVNKTIVEIDIFRDTVKMRNAVHSQLPVEIGDMFIHRDSGLVTVESSSGFLLECNTVFHVCTFELSGWYFGKTAGLLGTLNNEPYDDLMSSQKKKHNLTTVPQFAESWTLNNKCRQPEKAATIEETATDDKILRFCEDLYLSKVSQFLNCFSRVPTEPFFKMCLGSSSMDQACSSAVAYTTLCSFENTPLRIPDTCIRCQLPNNSYIMEGDFARFTEQNNSISADVVFLIETKKCNSNLTSSENMKLFIDSLDEELIANNIMNNRYAAVLFGGEGVYSEPRVRSLNGKIFTNSSTFINTLTNIPSGNGSADIFSALIYATKLNFRPAVSKSFILIPCSECQESSMKYDYPILHQLLSENAITLHILMNEGFNLQKTRDNKIPLGIDNRRAYTKKDFRILRGDESLRNHIKLPKSTMGLCMPLALETNGTLFASKYMKNEKDDTAKKFISVLSKRVAQSSNPIDCVDCECTAPNSGISYMECSSCTYPSRASLGLGFDEDELLMNLQPSESLEK